MPYPKTYVDQGDTIYFYDTSIGAVVGRDWFFPGGTPTGATSFGPAVVYGTPNSSGWDVKLLVTDTGGVTAAAFAPELVVVAAEAYSVSFTTTPSSSKMDQQVVYQYTGTAASGVTGSGFNWTIPGLGATSNLTFSTFLYSIPEWYDLTGTYVGVPNALYVATAQLSTTSGVGNSLTASQNVNFYKLGPQESVNYADGFYAASGPYYTPTVFGFRTSQMNLGGDNLVLQINQNYPSQAWDNAYFHSTDEAVLFYPNTTDYSAFYETLKFKFIWGGSNLTLGGISVPALPRFNTGNYIITGDVASNFSDKFWITDYTTGGASLTEYYESGDPGGRNWSSSYVQAFMSNTYHLSTSSKFIENGGFTGVNNYQESNLPTFIGWDTSEGSYDWSGGYGSDTFGVCVPSSDFLDTVYSEPGVDVDIEIKIYDPFGSVLDSLVVVLCGAGNSGNSTDGYLVLAQDNMNGSGIVSAINTAVTSSSLNGYILAEEASYFAPYEAGGIISTSVETPIYSKTTFHGIRVSVIQPSYSGQDISSFSMAWGPSYTANILGVDKFNNSVLSYPFAATAPLVAPGTPEEFISWSGMDARVYTNPNTIPYLRGWELGGSL